MQKKNLVLYNYYFYDVGFIISGANNKKISFLWGGTYAPVRSLLLVP
jgi:hypothetical protein